MPDSADRSGAMRALPLAILFVFLAFSVTACGGSDSDTVTPPPVGNSGDDDNDDDSDSDDDGDDDDNDNDNGGDGDDKHKPTGEISPDGGLAPRQPVIVVFSSPMNADTLQLGGTLAEPEIAWSDDKTTLTLTPRNYWGPGTRTLTVDATSTDDIAMDTLQGEFQVSQPFEQFQAASNVIGQRDLISGQNNQGIGYAAPFTLDHPSGSVAYSKEQDVMFLPDTGDSRVLGFEGIPTRNSPDASFVVGQADLYKSRWETSRSGLSNPQTVTVDGGHLIISEGEVQRVLIYEDVPVSGPVEPVAVLGQPSFETAAETCGPDGMRHAHGHFVTPDGKLMVADSGNHRILVWNEIPLVSGTDPDLVIGQRHFNVCAPNDSEQDGNRTQELGVPSERTMNHPSNLWSDGKRIIAADQYNHRVLIWNEFPQENFAPADVVLGQAQMNMSTPNDDDQDGVADAAATARTLNNPWTVWVENGQLFVADSDNHRVLVWNQIPQTSFAPADLVLGQPDFVSNAPNAGEETVNARGFNRPYGIRVINDRLYVTDMLNSRVLIFGVND